MLITTGKVLGGTIKIDAKSLPEGATVTVLAPEGDENFELSAEEEAKLLAAIAEADRGETQAPRTSYNKSADRERSLPRSNRQQHCASHC